MNKLHNVWYGSEKGHNMTMKNKSMRTQCTYKKVQSGLKNRWMDGCLSSAEYNGSPPSLSFSEQSC